MSEVEPRTKSPTSNNTSTESTLSTDGLTTPAQTPPPYKPWHANPSNGYVKHPSGKLLIHPSFYETITPTSPNYNPELDDPLCSPGGMCRHERSCFEMRVAMAVMAHRKGVSYRDAETLWGVSRSTIQRRKIVLERRSNVYFLVTPMKELLGGVVKKRKQHVKGIMGE